MDGVGWGAGEGIDVGVGDCLGTWEGEAIGEGDGAQAAQITSEINESALDSIGGCAEWGFMRFCNFLV